MTFSLSSYLFAGRRCSSARPRRTPASRNCSRHCSPFLAFCPPVAAPPARAQAGLRQRPAVSSDAHLPMSAHRPVAVSTTTTTTTQCKFMNISKEVRQGKGALITRNGNAKKVCQDWQARLASGQVQCKKRAEKKGSLWDKIPC